MLREKFKFIWRAWRYRKILEPAEIKFLLRHLRRGDTAVDIGAHKGGYTYWMRKAVGSGGKVFCFEPQPYLANKLRKIVKSFGYNGVRVENLGLSSTHGKKKLIIPACPDTSVGTNKKKSSPGATFERFSASQVPQSIIVPIETLDRYFADKLCRPIRLIKCDVEGHELEVFKGGETILREDFPILLFECEKRHRPSGSIWEVFDYLINLGYSGYFLFKKKTHPITEFSEDKYQNLERAEYINNFVFQREPK